MTHFVDVIAAGHTALWRRTLMDERENVIISA
jgi:hypothetical protein